MANSDFKQVGILRILVVISLLLVFSTRTVMASGKVNINTATMEELQTLPKIGPKTAEAIVKYREKHPFKSVDELLEVKGIGEKTLEKLKPLVTVGKKTEKEKKTSGSSKNKKSR